MASQNRLTLSSTTEMKPVDELLADLTNLVGESLAAVFVDDVRAKPDAEQLEWARFYRNCTQSCRVARTELANRE